MRLDPPPESGTILLKSLAFIKANNGGDNEGQLEVFEMFPDHSCAAEMILCLQWFRQQLSLVF